MRSILFVPFDELNEADSNIVRGFLIDVMQDPYANIDLKGIPTDLFKRSKLYYFKCSTDRVAFDCKLKKYIDDNPQYKHLLLKLTTVAIDRPTGRSIVCNNQAKGIHVYQQPGESIYKLAFDHNIPEEVNQLKNTFFGQMAKLWIMGPSKNAHTVYRHLRYALYRGRGGKAPLRFEEALELAYHRLGDNTRICIVTKTGNFFDITNKGVNTNAFVEDDEMLQAVAYGWDETSIGCNTIDIQHRIHGLSKFQTMLRTAAHECIILRNKLGLI